ncbi:MAG: hypothetical protein NTX50_20595 [Candidatus Sumerlaeota bacterium]|nr:hypothetical protein [Candidatus Sumerlaeota bacterium]
MAPFLLPRLIGPRFEEHAIPLEFLKDFAVLDEMVIEVAKWKFIQAHPDRQRAPRGFADGFELKLVGVEEGSAIPIIVLFAASVLIPPANQKYFEQGRDAILCAVEAAEKNKPVSAYLPEKVLAYFDKFGRSLREGEAIELAAPAQTTPPRLTKETRRKLVLASTSIKEITEEILMRGAIPEADQDDMTFEIQMFDGHKVKAPMASQHLETIFEAFTGYKTGTRVMLQGVGKFTRQGKLQGFESIEYISVLDPLDVPARLEELRSLKDGWLEGGGIAPPKEGMDWLAKTFDQDFPDDLPLPHIFPTPEGGIQAEWSRGPDRVTVDINLQEHAAEWFALNMDNDKEETRSLNLNKAPDWQWLCERIRVIVGGVA